MADVKVPPMLHKMSVSAQKAWYKKNKMEYPGAAGKEGRSAAQAKKDVGEINKKKAREAAIAAAAKASKKNKELVSSSERVREMGRRRRESGEGLGGGLETNRDILSYVRAGGTIKAGRLGEAVKSVEEGVATAQKVMDRANVVAKTNPDPKKRFAASGLAQKAMLRTINPTGVNTGIVRGGGNKTYRMITGKAPPYQLKPKTGVSEEIEMNEETSKLAAQKEPPFTPDKKVVRRGPGGPMSQAKWLAKQAMMKKMKELKKEEVELDEAKVSTVGASKASDAELASYLKKKMEKVKSGTGYKSKPSAMKEEAQYIEEKLTAADPASKWISDFVASDNPKFAGKSKKERINMALGAYYAATGKGKKNEEVVAETAGKITHIVAKDKLEDHKDAMDSEGYDTHTKPLPKNHPKAKTHIGIVSQSPVESDYHENMGHAEPIHEEVEQLSEGSYLQYSGVIHSNVGNAKHGEEKDEGHHYTLTVPRHRDVGDHLSGKRAYSRVARENPHLEPHHVKAILQSTGNDKEDVEVEHGGKTYKHRLYNNQDPDYIGEEVEQIDEGVTHWEYTGTVNGKDYSLKIPRGANLIDHLSHKKIMKQNPHLEPHEAKAVAETSGEDEEHVEVEHNGKKYTHHVTNDPEARMVYSEEVEQIDEAFDKSSPAHAKAQELVSNYGNRSAMRAVYHGDGTATIHTTGDKKVSSATRVDHIHDQAGLGYNRSAAEYKDSSRSKGGLKFKTKETEGKSIYGSHEIHISHKGMKEEIEQVEEKYMGFKAVMASAKKGGARDPAAVAAAIGRKKYGKEKFQAMAAAGKKANEEVDTGEADARKIAPSSKEKQKEVFAKHKERMKKLGEGMDPVGREDKDIDNDGDTDKTDVYLHNKRKAIRNAIRKKLAAKLEKKDGE